VGFGPRVRRVRQLPAARQGLPRGGCARSHPLRFPPLEERSSVRVELVRDFTFEAAHRLPLVPPEHKCHRMHGHSYRIEVVVAGEVDPTLGWLVDFGEIAARVEPVLKQELDHRVLNDVPGLDNPTSEILAAWLWKRFGPLVPQLTAITVH